MHIARMRLAAFMIDRGMDDEAMAALVRTDNIACDRSEISKYRRGVIRPSWAKIARIKEVTGDLVTGDDWLSLEAAE